MTNPFLSTEGNKMVKEHEFMTEEQMVFLDELHESGETNMFDAGCYLILKFPELNENEARIILSHWMETFDDNR